MSHPNRFLAMTQQTTSWSWQTIHDLVPVILCFGAGLISSLNAFAVEKSSEIEYPLVVVNAASIQRVHDNAGLMFGSAERSDMIGRVDQWLDNDLKGAKGFDHARPLGAMFYLSSNFMEGLKPVFYLPVTNLEEALATLANEAGELKPVDGDQNRHTIRYGETTEIHTLYRSGYLFVAPKEKESSSPLDRTFPDPEKMATRLTAQYDLAVSLMLKSLSGALKTTFLTFFSTQSKAHLQQRDNEPESSYRLRRANGEFWIELIERVVKQGEEFTLGGRLDPETNNALIEVELAGTRDSKLAKFFQAMVGKRTFFGNLLENPATFTLSTSLMFDEKQRKLYVTFFEAALKDLRDNSKVNESGEFGKLIEPLMTTLIATSEIGHLDAIAQMTGAEGGQFALVAGAKLATSRSLPDQVADLLQYLHEHPNGNQLLEKVEVNAETIDSYPVHRLAISEMDQGGQKMFGESPFLYVYANPQSLWCAFGGEAGLEALRNATQSVSQPQDVQQNRNRIPFLFITHAKNWLSVADEEDKNSGEFTQRANASFQSENDAMKLEIRPTDSGVRLRLEFESGYLSLLGRGITKGIEDGSFNRRQGRPGRQQKNPANGQPQKEAPQQ